MFPPPPFGKVDNPNSMRFLIRIPMFEWFVVWCGSKNGYKKDMCIKREWIACSGFVAILCSIVIIIEEGGGEALRPFNEHTIFSLQ